MGVLEMGGFVISWGLWRQFWAVVALSDPLQQSESFILQNSSSMSLFIRFNLSFVISSFSYESLLFTYLLMFNPANFCVNDILASLAC